MNKLIIKVEGMVCTGCENRIQNALKTIKGVEEVVANHTNGTVIVTSSGEVEKDALKDKIEDIGFKVREDSL